MTPKKNHRPKPPDDASRSRTRLTVRRSPSRPLRSRGGSRKLIWPSLCLVLGVVFVAVRTPSCARAALASPQDPDRVFDAADGVASHCRQKNIRLGRKLKTRINPPSDAAAADAQGGTDPATGHAFEHQVEEFDKTYASNSALTPQDKEEKAPAVLHEAMVSGRGSRTATKRRALMEEEKSLHHWLQEAVQFCKWVRTDRNECEGNLFGCYEVDVKCDGSNRVIWLDLTNKGLTGTVPTEMGDLTLLESLDLKDNQLTGSIPTEIGKLKKLMSLKLSANHITGTIPTEIGELTLLQQLYFDRNRVRGAIPTKIREMMHLKHLDLKENQLTGTIPTGIGGMTQLGTLDLSWNRLNGAIPTEIAELKNLETLALSGNSLTSAFPSSIWRLNTEEADAEGYQEGTGETRGNKLKALALDGNSLTGTIPSNILRLEQLEILNLDGNSLTGTIPSKIGWLTQLKILALGGNDLTGAIPEQIFDLTWLKTLHIFKSSLDGNISTKIGNLLGLTTLKLYDNSLSGTLPTEIGGLTNLRTLDLHKNDLTGKIPTKIGGLVELKDLSLHQNNFTGAIPAEIKTLTKIIDIDLHENQLELSIPTDIGLLTQLRSIDLSMNKLSGSIPFIKKLSAINVSHNGFDSFPFQETWSSLKSCDLSHNKFSQKIPTNLAGISSVERLVLSHNLLSGTIPTQLRSLLRLEWLHLDNNRLHGVIPDEIFSSLRLRELKLSNNNGEECFDDDQCDASVKEHNYGDTVCCVDGPCSKDVKRNASRFCFEDVGLWGTIPAGFGNVPYLMTLHLSGNSLSGNIPPELGDLSRLLLLDLSDNSLTGQIPFQLGALVDAAVSLNGNDDLGSDEHKNAPLSLCASVHRFDLAKDAYWCPQERNVLKAVYDSANGQEWTNADGWVDEYNDHCLWHGIECNDKQKIIKISLDNNGLSGRISSRITELESLSKLDLHDNDLQGNIPEQVGKLTELSYVRFSYNDITGKVPSGLMTLSQLDLLHIHGNRMNGEASDFSFEPQTASSLVADCGSPSDFDNPLICSACTTCCNSLGECHINTFAMSSSEMSNTNVTLVVMMSLMAFYSVLAAGLFRSKKTRMFISRLMFRDTAKGSTLNPFSSTLSAGVSPTFCESNSSCTSSNSAQGVCSPPKCKAWSAIGKESIYSFLLSTSPSGWLVSTGTLAAQAFVFGIFIQAADLDFDGDGKDWVYSWRCPQNSDECEDTSDSLVYGWLVFTILMIAFLAPDLINAFKLLWNFAVENQLSWVNSRCFISGFCLFSVTLLALVASIVYNIAIARSNTGLITNAVIILFVNDLDEQMYTLLLVISPKWFCDLMSELEEAYPEELSETKPTVQMQKQNVEKQETMSEQCKEEIEHHKQETDRHKKEFDQYKKETDQHRQEIDQLNAKLEELLRSAKENNDTSAGDKTEYAS